MERSKILRLGPEPIDVVGDVHGHLDPLRQLMRLMGYDAAGRHPEGRRLLFVGDLCDRGPDSPGVFELVMRAVEDGGALCLLGKKPSKTKRSVGRPATDSAAVSALAPGMGLTAMPAACAARVRRKPGSLISGVPASEISAIDSPAPSDPTSASAISRSLCSWNATMGVEIP